MSQFTKDELLIYLDAARDAMHEQFAGLRNKEDLAAGNRLLAAFAEIRAIVEMEQKT